MSDSDPESPTEYTALMDAHVGEIRPDLGSDRTGRKKKPVRPNASNFVSSYPMVLYDLEQQKLLTGMII